MNMRNSELPLDVWPRLIAIADEMATTMFRTVSHDVVEVHDMSTASGRPGTPDGADLLGATGHTGCMLAFGANLVEAFLPETVNPAMSSSATIRGRNG